MFRIQIEPSGITFLTSGHSSVLDDGLQSGLPLDYGCNDGNCGRCKVRLMSGRIERMRMHDFPLSEADKVQGRFLACCAQARSDLVIEAHLADGSNELPLQRVEARPLKTQQLAAGLTVATLRAPRDNRLRYFSGQSVRVRYAALRYQLPLASCPCDGLNIELHLPSGLVPELAVLIDALAAGERVVLEGPFGEFYLRDAPPARPLLVITDSLGFPAAKSLLEQAMNRELDNPIQLHWVADRVLGHYRANLCRSWADAWDNIHFHATDGTLSGLDPAGVPPADSTVYLSGAPEFTAAVGTALRHRGFTEMHVNPVSLICG